LFKYKLPVASSNEVMRKTFHQLDTEEGRELAEDYYRKYCRKKERKVVVV